MEKIWLWKISYHIFIVRICILKKLCRWSIIFSPFKQGHNSFTIQARCSYNISHLYSHNNISHSQLRSEVKGCYDFLFHVLNLFAVYTPSLTSKLWPVQISQHYRPKHAKAYSQALLRDSLLLSLTPGLSLVFLFAILFPLYLTILVFKSAQGLVRLAVSSCLINLTLNG